MIGLRTAIGFLTILPVTPRVGSSGFVSARAWFPIVGLVLGTILAATDVALASGYPLFSDNYRPFPTLLTASILVAVLVVFTRALHMDGFMDCCDGLLGGFSRARRLEILKDPNVGAFAVTGLACLLLLKVSAVIALPESNRLWLLLLFPCLSRWAVLLTMELFPYVREDGIGTPFVDQPSKLRRLLPLTVTLISALLLAGAAGLILMAVAGAAAWGVGAWSSKLLGGVTGDVYGATIEVAEVSVLIAAVLLTHVFPWDVFTSVLSLLNS